MSHYGLGTLRRQIARELEKSDALYAKDVTLIGVSEGVSWLLDAVGWLLDHADETKKDAGDGGRLTLDCPGQAKAGYCGTCRYLQPVGPRLDDTTLMTHGDKDPHVCRKFWWVRRPGDTCEAYERGVGVHEAT